MYQPFDAGILDEKETMSENSKKIKFRLEHWQVITLFLLAYDFIAILASYFGALWIRFDCKYQSIPDNYLQMYKNTILIYAVCCLIVFWFVHLYRNKRHSQQF